MHVYTSDILTAVVVFPFLALVITIPYMIYQYRKFGSIPWLRTLIVYSFIFYLLCAYFLVILPLPEDHSALVPYAQTPQLVPFNFVREFLAETTFSIGAPATWLATLKDPYIYEAIFNVALLVPLGMYLHYYFRRRWWQVLVIGFLTTLFFEISQLTGLFGLYAHPYRLFDVDDLILNTLGAMVGYLIVAPAMRVLPDIRVVNEEAREEGVHASFTRRALSFVLDMMFVSISSILLALFLVLTDGQTALSDLGAKASWISTGIDIVPLIVFFAIIPIITRGQTLGQMVLKLIIVRPDGTTAHWYQYFARYGLLYLFITGPFLLLNGILDLHAPVQGELSALMGFLIEAKPLIVGLWTIGLCAWVVSILIRALRARRTKTPVVMLNGLLSNTRVMTLDGLARMHDRALILDVADVTKLEHMLEEDGTSLAMLMKRAGHSVADAVIRKHPDPVAVTILCGAGNNGGDGWVVAGDLAALGYPVSLVTPMLAEHIVAEPARTAAIEIFSSATSQNLPLRVVITPDPDDLERELEKAEIIVDAMLGTGFTGTEVRDPYSWWIKAVASRKSADPEKVDVYAIDVPSGFSAQTGQAARTCITADTTVTMIAYKPGFSSEQSVRYCGEVLLAKIADVSPYLDLIEEHNPPAQPRWTRARKTRS